MTPQDDQESGEQPTSSNQKSLKSRLKAFVAKPKDRKPPAQTSTANAAAATGSERIPNPNTEDGAEDSSSARASKRAGKVDHGAVGETGVSNRPSETDESSHTFVQNDRSQGFWASTNVPSYAPPKERDETRQHRNLGVAEAQVSTTGPTPMSVSGARPNELPKLKLVLPPTVRPSEITLQEAIDRGIVLPAPPITPQDRYTQPPGTAERPQRINDEFPAYSTVESPLAGRKDSHIIPRVRKLPFVGSSKAPRKVGSVPSLPCGPHGTSMNEAESSPAATDRRGRKPSAMLDDSVSQLGPARARTVNCELGRSQASPHGQEMSDKPVLPELGFTPSKNEFSSIFDRVDSRPSAFVAGRSSPYPRQPAPSPSYEGVQRGGSANKGAFESAFDVPLAISSQYVAQSGTGQPEDTQPGENRMHTREPKGIEGLSLPRPIQFHAESRSQPVDESDIDLSEFERYVRSEDREKEEAIEQSNSRREAALQDSPTLAPAVPPKLVSPRQRQPQPPSRLPTRRSHGDTPTTEISGHPPILDLPNTRTHTLSPGVTGGQASPGSGPAHHTSFVQRQAALFDPSSSRPGLFRQTSLGQGQTASTALDFSSSHHRRPGLASSSTYGQTALQAESSGTPVHPASPIPPPLTLRRKTTQPSLRRVASALEHTTQPLVHHSTANESTAARSLYTENTASSPGSLLSRHLEWSNTVTSPTVTATSQIAAFSDQSSRPAPLATSSQLLSARSHTEFRRPGAGLGTTNQFPPQSPSHSSANDYTALGPDTPTSSPRRNSALRSFHSLPPPIPPRSARKATSSPSLRDAIQTADTHASAINPQSLRSGRRQPRRPSSRVPRSVFDATNQLRRLSALAEEEEPDQDEEEEEDVRSPSIPRLDHHIREINREIEQTQRHFSSRAGFRPQTRPLAPFGPSPQIATSEMGAVLSCCTPQKDGSVATRYRDLELQPLDSIPAAPAFQAAHSGVVDPFGPPPHPPPDYPPPPTPRRNTTTPDNPNVSGLDEAEIIGASTPPSTRSRAAVTGEAAAVPAQSSAQVPAPQPGQLPTQLPAQYPAEYPAQIPARSAARLPVQPASQPPVELPAQQPSPELIQQILQQYGQAPTSMGSSATTSNGGRRSRQHPSIAGTITGTTAGRTAYTREFEPWFSGEFPQEQSQRLHEKDARERQARLRREEERKNKKLEKKASKLALKNKGKD